MDRHEYYQLNWSFFENQNQGRTHKSKRFPTLKKLSEYFNKHLLIDDLLYEVYHIVETKLENSVKDRS